MSSGVLSSKRFQALLIDGVIVFGVVPAAFTLLFLITGFNGLIVPIITIYYIFGILGVALLAFERLAKQVRAGTTK
jgi:uncharacterized RDD family membrane protein YckC